MENGLKTDDINKDEDNKETESFFDRHPILFTLLILIVSGFITYIITVWIVKKADESLFSSCGNVICFDTKCITTQSSHKDNLGLPDTISITDKTNDEVGPVFAKTTGVGFYTFTVESKENLYNGVFDCDGEDCVARIETEVGYTLKINLADDRQDYYKLYDDLKVGHTYTCEVRDDKNSPSGMYAIIINCD